MQRYPTPRRPISFLLIFAILFIALVALLVREQRKVADATIPENPTEVTPSASNATASATTPDRSPEPIEPTPTSSGFVREVAWTSARFPRAIDGRTQDEVPPVVENRNRRIALPPELAEFDEWLNKWKTAPPSQRDLLLPRGLALAKARQTAFLELIRTDPEAAIFSALSPVDAEILPSDWNSLFEQRIAGVGTYSVTAVCNHTVEAEHSATCEIIRDVTLDGEIFRAHIYGDRNQRATEEEASLFGVAFGNDIALHEDDFFIEQLADQKRLLVTFRGLSQQSTIDQLDETLAALTRKPQD